VDSRSQVFFLLTAQTRLHRFHDLFVGVESLASRVLLEWSKQVKITREQILILRRVMAAPPALVHQEHRLSPVKNVDGHYRGG
jgi:hypothetical protein